MKNWKIIAASALAAVTLISVSCGDEKIDPSADSTDTDADEIDTTAPDEPAVDDEREYITVTADYAAVIDPPLLKKIEMYNAGCINPLDNYDRDFGRIRELNSTALRIDVSGGKGDGTGGKYLVGKDFEKINVNGNSFDIDLDTLEYDFNRLDRFMNVLKANDVLPYMSWSYLPYPLQKNGKMYDLDMDIGNWREAFEEIYYQYAKHYVDLGIDIGYHEVYNEPDLFQYVGQTTGFFNYEDFQRGAFLDMYEYGASGILRADPYATIGGPAYAYGPRGVDPADGFLARIKEKQLPLDFYSFHTYLDGTDWFMTQQQRKNGETNILEKVVMGLSNDPYFTKTAIHINEFSWLNWSNGSTDGVNSQFNKYKSAQKTLETLLEIVNRTSVQQIYWAQFMESTVDEFGLIDSSTGAVKPSFNAIKMYNDMPVFRYSIETEKPLSAVTSSEDGKLAVLIWNTEAKSQYVSICAENASFDSGVRRVYRIDKTHGSYYDKSTTTELKAEDVEEISTDGEIWKGEIPAFGVVYITVNSDGDEDFKSYYERDYDFDYVKIQYNYEDRYRKLEGSREYYDDYKNKISGSYSFVDRTSDTVYLGMGSATGRNGGYAGQAHANAAILCRDLPDILSVSLVTEGDIKMRDKNTALGFRIDYYDEDAGEYIKSVYFHNGLYDEERDPNAQEARMARLEDYPFGTEQKPDEVVELDGYEWTVDVMKYAPDGWEIDDGMAMLSFQMQNTGAHTRARFTVGGSEN